MVAARGSVPSTGDADEVPRRVPHGTVPVARPITFAAVVAADVIGSLHT
jgi:hypothetical protein